MKATLETSLKCKFSFEVPEDKTVTRVGDKLKSAQILAGTA